MSDREAFVAAIAGTPWDDTSRLVYADWLDEHGEPERAAFIRLQCRFHIASQFADPAVMPRLRTLHLYVSRDSTSADRPGIAGVRAWLGLRLIAW
jgi:uncharacterized protein (TIGR02996 family)